MDPTQIDPTHYTQEYLAEDISGRLLGVTISFMIIQTIFITLYYISNRIKKPSIGPEVYCFMLLGYLFCTANCTIGILSVKLGGTGRHEVALFFEDPESPYPQKLINWAKIDVANTFVYLCSITFPKLAITWFYVGIFTARRYRVAAYVTTGMIVATALGGIICSFFICRPFAYLWDPTIEGGKCGDVVGGYRYSSFPNVVTDVILLVLPLPSLYRLHVDLSVKIGLFITFLIGSAGLVTSVIRTAGFFITSLFDDRTYNYVTIITYTTVEPGVYLIAACMPSLRPLKQHVLKDFSLSSLLVSTFGGGRSKSTLSWRQPSENRFGMRRITDVELASLKVESNEA